MEPTPIGSRYSAVAVNILDPAWFISRSLGCYSAHAVKTTIRNALFWTAAWIVIVWFLIPAGASWHWDRSSLIRFDPQVSKDYDCIFVEGYAAKSFSVPWLSHSTPLEYLRIRYTPNNDQQQYGIMFVDPQALSYEAHDCCVFAPSHLAGRLDSPQPILDWLRSQPGSVQLPAHTTDASEIFEAIRILAPRDLEHFALPTNFPLKNFVVGHQSLAERDGPNLATVLPLLLIWLPVILGVSKKSNNSSESEPDGNLSASR